MVTIFLKEATVRFRPSPSVETNESLLCWSLFGPKYTAASQKSKVTLASFESGRTAENPAALNSLHLRLVQAFEVKTSPFSDNVLLLEV